MMGGGTLFDTTMANKNNHYQRAQQVDNRPYSFADLKEELKRSGGNHSQQNRGSDERRHDVMNHEEYLTDYMLNGALLQRKESAAAKLNPFNVVMEDNNKV